MKIKISYIDNQGEILILTVQSKKKDLYLHLG